MLPAIVQRRVDNAKAVARNLREASSEFPGLPGYTTRLLQASQTIDELVALLEQTTFVAKLNHDTIVARARR